MTKSKEGLTIITSHMNADYDAIASMLAAQKIYPEAHVVFPDTREKSMRNFFVNSIVYLFNMIDVGKVDMSCVDRLVLVDTRQKKRIGKLAELLKRKDMEIHIFDHHPEEKGDIEATYGITDVTGATITILVELLQKKKIGITADEATVMCLGIYEDTGSFTFTSTTEKDFFAAAYLLSKGANLNTISSLMAKEISPQQLGVLNDMLQAAIHRKINGVNIVFTTISSEEYINDFALLVHKMVKMENIEVLFAIARMATKIYIVARSRVPEADVGVVLNAFGGGGHAYAASCVIKGKTMAQTEQHLLDVLYKTIKAKRLARDIMSSPAIVIDPSISCIEAQALLTRYNINALPVVSKSPAGEELVGYITRQVIEKVLYHSMQTVPVREYMTTEVEAAAPDAEFIEIQDMIISRKQRILPVVDQDRVLGVITRSDILDILMTQNLTVGSGFPNHLKKEHVHTRYIKKFMHERLSNYVLDLLSSIGKTADNQGVNAYVVGGFVRDLLLYRVNYDIDIVIEGDGIAFAKKYATKRQLKIHTFKKFGTAVITFPDGFKVDVATARMEYYKFPAALPIVETSSLKLDLFRRDFTINTLCIQLNTANFGLLIDFFSAQRDLKDKVIRVLHNLSFVEDPTRVFRAIRFEQRFGFSLGKLTAGLIENAIKMEFLKRLSGLRVFSELRLILEEENPIPTIIRLYEYNLLQEIHPAIQLNKELRLVLENLKKVFAWHDLLFLKDSYTKWIVYFMVLVKGLDRQQTDEICQRLNLAQKYQTLLSDKRLKAAKCLTWMEHYLPVDNSILFGRLNGFQTELILYMMAITQKEKVKKYISRYYTQLRQVKPYLRGKDLIALGVKPGPIYHKILQRVLDAKLNGYLKTKTDEKNFVKQML